jgi:hypothetical protein
MLHLHTLPRRARTLWDMERVLKQMQMKYYTHFPELLQPRLNPNLMLLYRIRNGRPDQRGRLMLLLSGRLLGLRVEVHQH